MTTEAGAEGLGFEFLANNHHHVYWSLVNSVTDYLGINPGGILGAAGLLVDLSLPDGQTAKSCIITMVMMYPLMDVPSVKQTH